MKNRINNEMKIIYYTLFFIINVISSLSGYADEPTILNLSNQTTLEDNAKSISFTVTDAESNPLTLTIYSNNTSLIQTDSSYLTICSGKVCTEGDTYTITSGNYSTPFTLTIMPMLNASGVATITVSVIDSESLTATGLFNLSVTSVNDPPVLSIINDQTIDEDTALNSFNITVTDNETEGCSLDITFTSTDTDIIPVENISYTCNTGIFYLSIKPVANQSGKATITATVTDNGNLTSTRSFILTVNELNDAPVISTIENQSTNEDTVINTICYTATDIETEPCSLTLTFDSSNTTLVPTKNIFYVCNAGMFTLTINPIANQSGSLNITTTITDEGGLSAKKTFTLTVNPINDSPQISNITGQTTFEDTAIENISFTATDIESSACSLKITIDSSDQNLISNENITYNCSSDQYTIIAYPESNQSGFAKITVTVSDEGSLTAVTSFNLTVIEKNDPPVISDISDSFISECSTFTAIYLDNYVMDIEDADTNIHWTYSGNSDLKISINDRIAIIEAPNKDWNGNEVVTFIAEDSSGLTDTTEINFTVTAVNDAPILTISDTPLIYNENDGAVIIDSGITLTDVDDFNMTELVISINNYSKYQDELSCILQNKGGGNWDEQSGTLAFSETKSITEYLSILQSITYINKNENPTEDIRTITFTIQDDNSHNLGDGIEQSIANRNIEIRAVNDAPILTISDTPLIYNENDGAVIIDSEITLTDVDDYNMTELVILINNYFKDQDELSCILPNNGGGSWDEQSGTLTFSETKSITEYLSILQSITYKNTSDNPNDITRTITFTVVDNNSNGIGDAVKKGSNTQLINVISINDPPVISTTVTKLEINEDEPFQPISFSIADVDSKFISITVNSTNTEIISINNNCITICNGGNCSYPYIWSSHKDNFFDSILILKQLTRINIWKLNKKNFDKKFDEQIGIDDAIYIMKKSSDSVDLKFVDLKLNITPNVNQSGNAMITIFVTDSEGATNLKEITLTVKPKADEPILITQNSSGYEDSNISIKINSPELVDKDGSETLTDITIEGIPTGATLIPEKEKNGSWLVKKEENGSWLVKKDALDGLTVIPPEHDSTDMILTISVSSKELNDAYQKATAKSIINIEVISVPDEPILEVEPYAYGDEGKPIPIKIKHVDLVDKDGSEILGDIIISNIPPNGKFSVGTVSSVLKIKPIVNLPKIELPNDGLITVIPSGLDKSFYKLEVEVCSTDEDDRSNKNCSRKYIDLSIRKQTIKDDVTGSCFISTAKIKSSIKNHFIELLIKNINILIGFCVFLIMALLIKYNKLKKKCIKYDKVYLFIVILFVNFPLKCFSNEPIYYEFQIKYAIENIDESQTKDIFLLETKSDYSNALGFQFGIGKIIKKNNKIIEGTFDYLTGFKDDEYEKNNKIDVANIMGNFKYIMPVSNKINFYFMLGLGMMITKQNISFRDKELEIRDWGPSIKPAVGADIILYDNLSLGFELAAIKGFFNVNHIQFNNFAINIKYRFGKANKKSISHRPEPEIKTHDKAKDEIDKLNFLISQLELENVDKIVPEEMKQLRIIIQKAKNNFEQNIYNEVLKNIESANIIIKSINDKRRQNIIEIIDKVNKLILEIKRNDWAKKTFDSNQTKNFLLRAKEYLKQELFKESLREATKAIKIADSVYKKIENLRHTVEQKIYQAKLLNEKAQHKIDKVQSIYGVKITDDIILAKNYYNNAKNAFNKNFFQKASNCADNAIKIFKSLINDLDLIVDNELKKIIKGIEQSIEKVKRSLYRLNFIVSPNKISHIKTYCKKTEITVQKVKNKDLDLISKYKLIQSAKTHIEKAISLISYIKPKNVSVQIIIEAAGDDPTATDFLKARDGVVDYLEKIELNDINKTIDVNVYLSYENYLEHLKTINEIKVSLPVQAASSVAEQFKKAFNSFNNKNGLKKIVYIISSARSTVIVPDNLENEKQLLNKKNISFNCIFITTNDTPYSDKGLEKLTKETKGTYTYCKDSNMVSKALKEIFKQ